jgi:REP element-mobilizing transposase RayT
MARPLRIAYPGAVYHVTARGNARQAIGRDDADRQRFVATLADTVTQYRVRCHAWVLMPNHYHLLLETPESNLSAALRHLNGVYTQAFNRRHRRVGHLFQGRFTAILVEKERYLLALCRYIVLNPVRAQLVRHPRAWRWSSYRATSGEVPAPPWLTTAWLLGQFGTRRGAAQRAYRQFVEAGLRQQASPWTSLVGQIYLGSEAFRQRVQRLVRHRPDPEIPQAQRFPARPAAARLLHQVATLYGVAVADLLRPTWRPSEARQVAMALLRQEAGLGLRAIAARFGVGYSAVSHRLTAVRARLAADPAFKARVQKCKSKT